MASPQLPSPTHPTTTHPPPLFVPIPPPWHVRGDIYCISFWSSGAAMPAHAYSPLEAASTFAADTPPRGLGMIQIIRYKESPVGPYDEMLVVPGSLPAPGGKAKSSPRISRMYVSDPRACYNGRLNWNCPKHLARFEWTAGPNGAMSVAIHPHDASHSSDPLESRPCAVPFFHASFAPLRLAPSFPFATRWLSYLGLDTTLVMPPLPAGRAPELPGTHRWCSFDPKQYSRKTRLGWFDLAQSKDSSLAQSQDSSFAQSSDEFKSFWPGLGRWALGVKMEDAEVVFDVPNATWAPLRAKL